MNPERQRFVAAEPHSGRTVLAALRIWLPGQSWSDLRKLLAARRVLVNDALCLDEARRLAAGERVNNQVGWTNVIEEIGSVGNAQVHAVGSLLPRAIIHRLKALVRPAARDADNWRADAARFSGDVDDRFVPSLRQRLDLAHVRRRALRAVPAGMYGQPRPPLPAQCPWSPDELLGTEDGEP